MKKLVFLFVMVFAVSFIGINPPISAQNYRVFAVSDLIRVFEDGYNLAPSSDTMKIFGIRGEIISGQCVVNALDDLYDLTVELSSFKNKVSGNLIPATIAEWNFVGSVSLTENTRGYPINSLTRKAPARYPDYLMEEKLTDMKKGSYKSVWVTLNIPETSEAGTYSGEIIIKDAGEKQSLPVSLTIYPLTLPAERHLNIGIWHRRFINNKTRNFEKWHGIKEQYSDEWFAMLKNYADNMVEHRANSFSVSMRTIEIEKLDNGTFSFDFSLFDKIAQVFWDTGKMDYMETGFLLDARGVEGWSTLNFRWRDFSVIKAGTGENITLPGKEVIPSLVMAFESHLRSKGWLNKTWFHVQDEPVIWNSLSWVELSKFIHRYAPDLIRIDAVETTWVVDDIEIVCPKLNHFASWYDTYRKAHEKGVEVFFYTVGIAQGSLYPNRTIDVPLIQSRTLHWMNYKYDATGYLHWGWDSWTDDPFNEVGMHVGDGWQVYPAKNGVLNSLRWEQMRNGIQDYEYLWMLENMISELRDSLGTHFNWIDPQQRGKEITSRIIKDFSDFSDDPDVMYRAKMEVIKEMLDFNRSPKIYIQTNPALGPDLHKGSSVELYGWTEQGTNITINGRELAVKKNGLFVTKLYMGRGDMIRVEASNSNGSKEIIRTLSE